MARGGGVAEFLQAVYSNHSAICNGFAAVYSASLTVGFNPQSVPSRGGTGVAYNKYSPEFVLPSTYYIYNLYSPSTYYIYNL